MESVPDLVAPLLRSTRRARFVFHTLAARATDLPRFGTAFAAATPPSRGCLGARYLPQPPGRDTTRSRTSKNRVRPVGRFTRLLAGTEGRFGSANRWAVLRSPRRRRALGTQRAGAI